ncbi:SRPBCC family protein [Nocardia cyriacigeorgica]|uniref:SRPBCC family protein n=1 Tax=Nocardia cyriacigeorgica TaxID=135487 RepID=A0A5R8NDG5_9NOCA|nr:SRPBCC family protein [Nocardia cyriacigeorgica]TLF73563.1 SRPBCC family protein [Nocardia cyriacigeorgica]
MKQLVIVAAVLVVAGAVAGLIALAILRARVRKLLSARAEPESETLLDTLQSRRPTFEMTVVCRFHAPPERIYDALGEGAFSWFPLINGIRYQRGERGVGAMRTLDALLFAAVEQVTRAEPGRRLTVVGVRTSVPLVVLTYQQDFRLEPTADGGTDVSWTVGGRPAIFAFLPASWVAPFVRPFARFALGRLSTRVAA